MTASAGSAVFFVAALLAICAFVLLLLRHYLPLRPTPAYLLLPVFLALALPASIILLVPIDLATVFTQDDTAGSPKGIWLPPRVVLVAWRITYWLTFALTWIILPLVGEYVDAGHRSPRSRFMYALNANLRYQAIVLGLAIAAGVYVFLTSGVSFASLKALVMALAYAWGLVLAIALMGHGLVALPREMFKQASTSGRLRRAQARAPRVHEKLLDAEDELAEVEDQVRVLSGRKRGTALDFQDWIDELAEGAGVHEAPSAAARGTTNTTAPAVITERYLAELTRRLHRAKHKRARFADEWECLVDMAVEAQAILDAAGSQRLEFSPRPDNSSLKGSHPLSWQSYVSKTWRKASKAWLTPRTRYYLHANILPSISVFVAILAAVASVFLVETEMLRPFSVQQGALIPLTVRMFAPRTEAFDFSKQFVSAFWLCYAVACTLYSVSFVRVWRGRALVRRGTHPESAAWYAALAARLAVPLAYHVGSMLTQSDGAWDRTVFHDFLGRMIDFTPLGEGFSRWFPVFVLVPMVLSAGGWKALRGLGGWLSCGGLTSSIVDEDDEDGGQGDAFGAGGWREGRGLIERAIQERSLDGTALGVRRESRRGGHWSLEDGAGEAARRTDTGTGRQAVSFGRTVGGRPRSETGPLVDAPGEDEPEEEENFFEDFAHRVRNTIDTVDRPTWLPRWMGGDGGGDSNSGDSGDVLGRWFGGGQRREGRIRL